MSSWASHRRRLYFAGALGIVALVAAVIWLFNLKPASCFDGRQNQDEVGADCGGSCAIFCPAQVFDPAVRWSRTFAVSEGLYNAVAYIENRNPHAGTRRIPYTFKFFDPENTLIAERSGEAFIPPQAVVPIFEGSIKTDHVLARTTFEFTGRAIWERPSIDAGQALVVGNSALNAEDPRPTLTAEVRNNSIYTAHDIGVVAVVYDAKRNAVAASRTVIDEIAKDEAKTVAFTWPKSFEKRLEVCKLPIDVVLITDRSGTMTSEGKDPAQPLTSAIEAAQEFVGRLSPDDRAAYISFATNASNPIDQVLTTDKDRLKQAIGKTAIGTDGLQATNIGDALKQALDELSSSRHDKNAQPAIVLLTDGDAKNSIDPNSPDPSVYPSPYAFEMAQKVKAQNVKLYTIGLGSASHAGFVREFATTPDHYFPAASGKDLDAIYTQISESLCEHGPAIIDIIPLASDLYFR